MGVNSVKILITMLCFLAVISSCIQRKVDNDKLCIKFCELNKGKNFDGLYDIAIGVRRLNSIYNESSNQYEYVFNSIDIYDYNSDDFIMLPLFKRNSTLSEKDSTFKKVGQEAKNYLSAKYNIVSEAEMLDSFVKYVDMVYVKYDNIETPDGFGFKNVLTEGNPRSGKFIAFTLNDQCKVYYLSDDNSLTEYWKKYFKKLTKLDNQWYYEVIVK